MEVAAEDGTVVRLPSGRARVVLAVLCAEAGREVTSDRLIDLAWNGNPPATSATQLHGLISALRRAFGPAQDVIVTRPDGYVLRADVDLARMRELIRFAGRCLEGGNLDQAAASFIEALALWRGRPFTGFDHGELATTGELIEQEYVSALEDYAETELRRGNHALLTPRLAEWVSVYPLRESLRGSYITALACSGRQAEAIASYHQLRQRLSEDLGVDPSQRLQALYQQILSGDLNMTDPMFRCRLSCPQRSATSPAGRDRSRSFSTRWPPTGASPLRSSFPRCPASAESASRCSPCTSRTARPPASPTGSFT